MQIFVAGATGAVGRRLIPLLVSAGHSVTGLTHTPSKAGLISTLGAKPVVADGLDKHAIREAVALHRPDVVVHEMTDLKDASDLRRFDRAFASSNRLRTEGTEILMAAAKNAGVRLFVAQSFCGWPYARIDGPVKVESDPLDPNPPQELQRSLDALRYLEQVVTGSLEPEGIVLRYGAFYGSDTGLFDGPLINQIRHRRSPLIGDGEGWWSFLHIDDAAAATLAAIERGEPGSIYNIVDDEPAPARDWLPALAEMLGAKPPFRVPTWLARLLAGEHVVTMMTQGRAGSNEKAKRELGWRPAHPSWRLCRDHPPAPEFAAGGLEHDPEKWMPVFG
jgi:nucleoside-diphosphate-sugar epimerase